MDPGILFVLIALLTIGAIMTGIILINIGMKPNAENKRNLDLVKAGWLVLGIYSVLLTIGLVLLCIVVPSILVILIFLLPIAILVGLAITLSYGIYYLALGYSKTHPDTKLRSIGWTCLIINISIVTTIVLLLVFFMSGLIPIRLM